MILADKIIRLRKRNGWSQEELADKLNVSRQAVSKWEATQTTPDLEKILQLSNLFGVTTDYLLKDEIEDEEFSDSTYDLPLRKLSLKEANDYLQERKKASVSTAVATLLCICSAIPLLLLIAISDFTSFGLPSNWAVGIGVVSILIFVAIAVAIYISVGFKNAPFEFLEKGQFETEYGVIGLAKENQKNYRKTYVKFNIIGASICVLSPIPLICAVFINNEFLTLILLCVTLLLVSLGVLFFIMAGVRWGATQKILGEGEYSKKGKLMESRSSIYWLSATAIYLIWSFISTAWHTTWIVWPIAAVLFSVVEAICNLTINKKNKD